MYLLLAAAAPLLTCFPFGCPIECPAELAPCLPADADEAVQEVCDVCEILDDSQVLRLSAKTGLGVDQVLPSLIE